MLHILVVILKLIGIIILTILLLVLFLLTIVLFVPVRYRAYAVKKDEIYAKINASWMLHLLHFKLYFDKNGLQIKFNIAGISSQKWKAFFIRLKRIFVKEESKRTFDSSKEKRSRRKQKRNEEVIPKNKKEELDISKESEITDLNMLTNQHWLSDEDRTIQEKSPQHEWNEKTTQNNNNTIQERISKNFKPKRRIKKWFLKIINKIKMIIERFKNIGRKVILTLKNAKDKVEEIRIFIKDEGNRQAFLYGKGQLFRLIKHLKPRKYKINLKFGTGDPALTGQILGIIATLMPVYKNNASIIPDFENIILEGDIYMKGRITIAKLLLLGFQLYQDKNVKRCYQMIID